MAKNRTIPFGYCMKNGEIITEPREFYAVATIFSEYLKGSSLLQIAILTVLNSAIANPSLLESGGEISTYAHFGRRSYTAADMQSCKYLAPCFLLQKKFQACVRKNHSTPCSKIGKAHINCANTLKKGLIFWRLCVIIYLI